MSEFIYKSGMGVARKIKKSMFVAGAMYRQEKLEKNKKEA